MTWPPDRLSDPLLQGLYSNCRNDSIRLLLMNKVSGTVISLTLPDFTDAPPSLTVSPPRPCTGTVLPEVVLSDL